MRPTWIHGLLLLALLGCEGMERAAAPSNLDVAAAPSAALRIPFELYGVPGPWWREDATQADFDRDMWTCRTASKEARTTATSETRKDVAYRAFLDCMTGLTWSRGYPPPEGAAG